MHTQQCSHCARYCSDQLAHKASQSVDAASSEEPETAVQRILRLSQKSLESTSYDPDLTLILQAQDIHHTNPYRRVISTALRQYRAGRGDRVQQVFAAIDQLERGCNSIVALSREDWQGLELTFSWIAMLELTSSGVAPKKHNLLAAGVCLSDRLVCEPENPVRDKLLPIGKELQFVDRDAWSFWLRSAECHTFQWLFDDQESYQNRLIPDKADQRSWLARVGQIVKEQGRRWTPNGCEED